MPCFVPEVLFCDVVWLLEFDLAWDGAFLATCCPNSGQ
jgi:hypothetical protein